MKTTGALLLLAASLASAAPATSPATPLQGRQIKTLCDQYGYWSGNGYEVNNNAWGKGAASSGSQCTYIDNSGGNGLGWHAQWNWQGGQNNVKSYPYAGRQLAKGRTIQSINSLPTSVQWSYSSSNIRADVAYDLFTARDPNHDKSSGDYELMIWLAKYGDVQPIGSPVGNVNVGGRSWQLWSGMNGSMRVFSFVTTSGPITSWSGDVKQFYSYLTQSQGFPASQQNLLTFQFGTEPFTGGPATFQVNNFSANMS